MNDKPESPRKGFAAMDAEQRRAIASKGGKAAHRSGNAHQFTAETARIASQEARSPNRETTVPAGWARPRKRQRLTDKDLQNILLEFRRAA